ncbi:MAG TPA: Glu-tRNA(Gln) amidotransferase subunit GatD [archaeon]|nr:Glu-tRNA(Gln) amidotransferase subunit GatD [archaeon]
MDYSAKTKKLVGKASVGDRIAVRAGGGKYEGFLMPKHSGSPDTISLKLESGYDIGIRPEKISVVKKAKNAEPEPPPKHAHDPSKPVISILHTGGTIASKVDYKTGSAFPAFEPEELTNAVPEIKDLANFRASVLFQMLSEDMEPDHWVVMARRISEEIEKGSDGVIIFHGTDTMSYSAAAVSFMLQNLPVPVIFVGAQRSADRGSSDAAMNIICAVNFAVKSDFAGVGICMHGSASDNYCIINPAVNVKKMHTSRRDAFRPVDVKPYAKANYNGSVEILRSDYLRKDKKRKPVLRNGFEKKITLLKIRPGFNFRELELYKGYTGIILEGTGLGNAPVSVLDEFTKHHAKLLDSIEKMCAGGVKIFMVSQCPYGRVNMNVYSTGKLLQKAGIVPLRMTPEAAYVKLGWALANFPKQVEEIMLENFCGEIVENIKDDTFLI